MKPTTLIIRTAGTNCDRELAHAFELAGAAPRIVHLHDLIARPRMLEEFDLIGFPGGFSYGDDIAAGRILANRLRHRLLPGLQRAVARGVPMIGICNGFQVLVKLGLLPGEPTPPEGESAAEVRQTATLADNLSGRFIDRWCRLEADDRSVCLWTRDLDPLDLPIAHGEGRFVASAEAIARWRERGQIALRYVVSGDHPFAGNPNGSMEDIAGVCDPTGVVLGLMPHPERFTHATHHPHWTRMSAAALAQTPAGLRVFQNAVSHVAQPAMTH